MAHPKTTKPKKIGNELRAFVSIAGRQIGMVQHINDGRGWAAFCVERLDNGTARHVCVQTDLASIEDASAMVAMRYREAA